MSKTLKLSFLFLLIVSSALIATFQGCIGNINPPGSEMVVSTGVGNGHGFRGKPVPGDSERRNSNSACASFIQSALTVTDQELILTLDDCLQLSEVYQLDDPRIDFAPYNPKIFMFGSGIFRLREEDPNNPYHPTYDHVLCRKMDDTQGLDISIYQRDIQGPLLGQNTRGNFSNGEWTSEVSAEETYTVDEWPDNIIYTSNLGNKLRINKSAVSADDIYKIKGFYTPAGNSRAAPIPFNCGIKLNTGVLVPPDFSSGLNSFIEDPTIEY